MSARTPRAAAGGVPGAVAPGSASPSSCPPDPARGLATLLEARLARVLEIHFDPRWGSPYWLERARVLRIDPRLDVRSLEDLDVFGILPAEDLRRRPLLDFVPRSLLDEPGDLILGESGGTLGPSVRTAFQRSDFHAAFVAPFVAAAHRVPFPRGAFWAWFGPGGPHIIGKAAREVCRAMGSPDPFAIDFDPRWYRLQAPGSLGRARYLGHVIEQALDVLRRERVEVLFSTPPVLAELGKRLPDAARDAIRAVHLGGLPVGSQGQELLRMFERASILSGYGNSLLGMCPQLEDRELERPRYYPHGDRLWLRVVAAYPGMKPPFREVAPGERGAVLATRLDVSSLLINLLERDTAVRLPPPPGGGEIGFLAGGLERPEPDAGVPASRLGIY